MLLHTNVSNKKKRNDISQSIFLEGQNIAQRLLIFITQSHIHTNTLASLLIFSLFSKKNSLKAFFLLCRLDVCGRGGHCTNYSVIATPDTSTQE